MQLVDGSYLPPAVTCLPVLQSDAGALGSALQVYALSDAVARAWRSDAYLLSVAGVVNADGADDDAGVWVFEFQSHTGQLASVSVAATATRRVASCVGSSPAEQGVGSWPIDSPQAVAIMLDAGCPLAFPVGLQLLAQSQGGLPGGGSPLGPVPAWFAVGTDGGAGCLVDAINGAFGPDGGLPDSG